MRAIPYFIGDIHGCLAELQALEEIIAKDAAGHGWRPLVISVGDLVDRGPASQAVVELFRKNSRTHVCVLGNHECELLRQLQAYDGPAAKALNKRWPRGLRTIADDFAAGRRGAHLAASFDDYRALLTEKWLEQGGRETLLSYGADPAVPGSWVVPAEHLSYLTGLPLVWQDQTVVVTHALADPDALQTLMEPPAENAEAEADEAADAEKQYRDAVESALWNRRAPGKRIHPKLWHVSGHTPQEQVIIRPELAYTQIDTGCVYGRRLTAYCQHTESFFAVDSQTVWGER